MRRVLLASTAVWLAAFVTLGGAATPASAAPSVSGGRPVSDPVSRLADGSQTEPVVAFGSGRYLAVWTDSRESDTVGVWAARVTAAGAVLDPSGIPVAIGLDDVDVPAVVFDGSNFLITWAAGGDIFGARVSGTGRVLDPTAFAISSATGEQGAPAVATNGAGSLVVWQDRRSGAEDIWSARVEADGDVVDPAGTRISGAPNAQTRPAVSFDGANYLAVWEDARAGATDIYGARVAPSGALLNPSGIQISAAAGAQVFPDVASNGSASLVAWHDFRSGVFADIRATRVSRPGTVLDPPSFVVNGQGRDQFEPEVAFDGANYVVAWTDLRNGPLIEHTDVFASRVTPAGTTLDGGGIAVSADASGQFRPALASNGTASLVVWADLRSTQADVHAARLNRFGAVLDPDGIVLTTAASVQANPSVAVGESTSLVAWVEQRDAFDSRVLAGRLGRSGGHLDGAGIPIGEGVQPQVAYDGTNFLVVWNDPSLFTSIRAVRVSPAGQVLDSPSIAVGGGGDPSVAFNGTTFLVSWTQTGSTQTFDDVRAARVSRAGVVLNRLTVAGTGDPESDASVASDGTNFLVVWTFLDDSFTRVAVARRVSGGGALLGTGRVRLAPVTTDQLDPVVAFSGTRYLVVWTELHDDVDLFASRVSTAGATVGARGFPVTTAGGDQHEPSVAGGNSFLVVWTHRRDTRTDVRGTRVDQAGQILDGAGFGISTTATVEQEPAVAAGPGDRASIAYQRFAPEAPLGAPRVFLRTAPK